MALFKHFFFYHRVTNSITNSIISLLFISSKRPDRQKIDGKVHNLNPQKVKQTTSIQPTLRKTFWPSTKREAGNFCPTNFEKNILTFHKKRSRQLLSNQLWEKYFDLPQKEKRATSVQPTLINTFSFWFYRRFMISKSNFEWCSGRPNILFPSTSVPFQIKYLTFNLSA